MDLMASTSRQTSKTLPFILDTIQTAHKGLTYWRRTSAKYRTPENLASVSVSPPPSMVGVLISHIQACCARAVIIVPDTKAPWLPLLRRA